jgi:hypothetical protein
MESGAFGAKMLTPLPRRFLWGCVKNVVRRIIVADIAPPRRKIPLAVLIATTDMFERMWHTYGMYLVRPRSVTYRNIVIVWTNARIHVVI